MRVRRRAVGVATALAVLGAAVAGCGSSSKPARPAAAPSALSTTVLASVGGPVLVDGRGFALYLYVPDHRQAVTCAGPCAAAWPPDFRTGSSVRTGGAARAGLVGADPDPVGGRPVVTYAGWPLYRWVGDLQPGYATGQGVDSDGGYWYLLRPDGTPIVPAGDPPAT